MRIAGSATYRGITSDLMTFRDHNITEVVDDTGKRMVPDCKERYCVPGEINWLLPPGFINVGISGAKPEAFSGNNNLTTEDFEMLVIAEKK